MNLHLMGKRNAVTYVYCVFFPLHFYKIIFNHFAIHFRLQSVYNHTILNIGIVTDINRLPFIPAHASGW
ncbi:MAG: hypothetical protein BWY90_01648 [Deltaproteobacteria bacterium ADurb.BinA014]|nr:MAG: hypothetical protein BWY90_01648 [Deltaproteobacteria bacterium ADurb.BinA014]